MGQMSFFTMEDRFASLSKCGDPLERLNIIIPWEEFRPVLNRALRKERKSEAGRKPFDYVMMLKILLLESLYNLADDQMEYQIRDRLSFTRFLGLTLEDTVPDAKTIWHFREVLTQMGVIKGLFQRFNRYLEAKGYKAKKGQLIDATIVEVPRQKMTIEEKAVVEEGKVPESWKENPAQECQKDVDAKWTKKRDTSYFGYKNHVNADAKHKLIRDYAVSPANMHDSEAFNDIVSKDTNSKDLYADCAYRSVAREKELKAKGYRSHIHSKGHRNNLLSKFQGKLNMRKSRIRARVEHVFGHMVNTMDANFIRCIGLIRAAARIGLNNLAYNLNRYAYLAGRA
jgi:IS5 family transposase